MICITIPIGEVDSVDGLRQSIDDRKDGCGHLVVLGKTVDNAEIYACRICNGNVTIGKRYIPVESYDPEGIIYLKVIILYKVGIT